MLTGRGRGKGFGFEIEIARKLSLWVLDETSKKPSVDLFWRSTGSGGKSAVERKKGRLTKSDGDIMSIDKRGEFFTDTFFIECKSYKKFCVFSSMMEQKGVPFDWWKKCVEQADNAAKEPIMIIKMNAKKPIIMFETCLATDIFEFCDGFEENLSKFSLLKKQIDGEPLFENVSACYFDAFLRWVTPLAVKKLALHTNYT